MTGITIGRIDRIRINQEETIKLLKTSLLKNSSKANSKEKLSSKREKKQLKQGNPSNKTTTNNKNDKDN